MKGYTVLLFSDSLLSSFKLANILHSAAFFLQSLDPINPYVENYSRCKTSAAVNYGTKKGRIIDTSVITSRVRNENKPKEAVR